MSRSQAAQSPYAGSRGRMVFVVDDHAMVRELVCRILESEGLQVVDADGPVRALELVERFETPPDLMICDVCMPVMSGPELYQLVLKRFPALSVLFITAYPDEHLEQGCEIITEERLLRKPFRCAELVERVRRMLG